jgi:hypothetical protein
MITLTFTSEQAILIASVSPTFAEAIVKQLDDLGNKVVEVKKEFPSEADLLETLQIAVQAFSCSDKILAIKFVRTFVQKHQGGLSPSMYAKLYSLAGAKAYVEQFLGGFR